MHAPVVVFGFNRPEVFCETIKALKNNSLAPESNLYIFIDGPRNNHDVPKVAEVVKIAHAVTGFKSVTVNASSANKGLAQSIISGVTEIIEQYGKVIVVEDDLIVAPSFLTFMNQFLNKYEHDYRIFQISGFGVKIRPPKDYKYDIYINIRAQSWTWGTWKDRWKTVDWEVSDFIELSQDKKKQRAFNKGGSDLFGMLKGYMTGINNSWYIRFNYSMFKQKKYAIVPVKSLVLNEGFGAEATHCNTYNRYKVDFQRDEKHYFTSPCVIEPDSRLYQQAVKYWSIRYRIYGKIMTLLYKLMK